MNPTHYFVVAATHLGLWLGVVKEDSFKAWKANGGALPLLNVRALQAQPMGNERMQLRIGSPYVLDTAQKFVYCFPVSIEVLGELENFGTSECVCSDNRALFNDYDRAFNEYCAMRANLTVASPEDLKNLEKAQIFTPGKKRK